MHELWKHKWVLLRSRKWNQYLIGLARLGLGCNGGVIYDLTGIPIAFIQGSNVFGFEGFHKGEFRSGFFRDGSGNAVAFLRSARGGPLRPLTQLPPLPPVPAL